MVLSVYRNLGAIIGSMCNTSHVLIHVSLKLFDCFVIVSDNMNEDPSVLCFMRALSLNSINDKIFNHGCFLVTSEFKALIPLHILTNLVASNIVLLAKH